MNSFRYLIALLLLVTACGCNAVISRNPIGEKPVKLSANDWEGDWLANDGSLKIKVVDADKGLLKVFWLEEDQKSNPVMKTADVALRESGGWMFANTKEENKVASRGYLWGRIKNEHRQIVVWIPDDKAFSQLVKRGVFRGKIDGDDIILDELKPEHLKVITSGARGVLFEWDKPAVLLKIGK